MSEHAMMRPDIVLVVAVVGLGYLVGLAIGTVLVAWRNRRHLAPWVKR